MDSTSFSFTSSGVQDWHTYVDQGGQSRIDAECAAIASDFTSWISARFSFDPDQVAFVEELDPLLIQSYAAALQYALQQGVDIQLQKEEAVAKKDLNPKVAIMEEKIERWRNGSNKQANAGDSLIFKILYP